MHRYCLSDGLVGWGKFKQGVLILAAAMLLAPNPASEAATGYNLGDTVADFTGTNADGTGSVSLYDNLGQKTILAISANWCEPCKEIAAISNDIIADLANSGISVNWIELLGEGVSSIPATPADGTAWADEFNFDYNDVWIGSAVTDAYNGLGSALVQGPYLFQIPLFVILDEDLKILGAMVPQSYDPIEFSETVQSVYNIPEPATASFCLMGLGLLSVQRRRKL